MLYEELSKFHYSPSLYISGIRALNTPDFENNTGDWHRGMTLGIILMLASVYTKWLAKAVSLIQRHIWGI